MHCLSDQYRVNWKGVLLPIAGGAVISVVAALLLWSLKPIWVALIIVGSLAFLPALLVKDSRVYWLALFLFLLPLGLNKMLGTQARVDDVLEKVGGTWGYTTIIIQLTDIILIILIGMWGVRHWKEKRQFYFPKISYLPLGYLLWATLGVWFAPYPELSVFELLREYKYYVFYLFIINNVDLRKMSKTIIAVLLLSLFTQGAITIAKYKSQNVENIFLSLGFGQAPTSDDDDESEKYRFESVAEGSTEDKKRAVGTLPHPTGTAMHLELILPLALTLFLAGRKNKGNGNAKVKWLYLSIFLVGAVALYTTFSRGGMLGFLFSTIVCVSVLALRGLLPKTFIVWGLCVAAMLAPVASYKLHGYLTTRPEYSSLHVEHIKIGIAMLQINPIMGVGLNNTSFFRPDFTPGGESELERALPIHSHYLLGLIETGIVGFGLYCMFFIRVMIEAFRWSRSSDFYTATLAISILGAYSALAIHVIADYAGADALQTMFWLYAGLIVALRRKEPDALPISPIPQSAHAHQRSIRLGTVSKASRI